MAKQELAHDNSGLTFQPFTDFNGKEFQNASFRGAVFEGKVTFQKARFMGFTDFSGAMFKGPSDFCDAIFEGDAVFHGAPLANPPGSTTLGSKHVRFR